MDAYHFVLASQSPRRRQLLRLLGYPFEVYAADVDEDVHLSAGPAAGGSTNAIIHLIAIARRLRVPLEIRVWRYT